MYHLLNPTDVFFRLRPLLKRDGLLLMESAYSTKETNPVLRLNSESEEYPQPTTYFLPSASAITGLAHLACTEVIGSRHNAPSRFSLLGRAVLPEEIVGRTETCRRMHHMDFEDPSFNLGMLEGVSRSSIEFSGDEGHLDIDIQKFSTAFPTQPNSFINILGNSLNKRTSSNCP